MNMLSQTSPPDTSGYLFLGYLLIGMVGLFYVFSLVWRQRNLRHDLDVVARLQGDESDNYQ